MSGIAWASLASFAIAVMCFLRGAFAISWDGLVWMFYAVLAFVVSITLLLVKVFS